MRTFRIPLRTRFRGVDHRQGVLLSGPCGWGEFSPFPRYPPAVTARWLAAAREAATRPWPAPLRRTVPVNVTVPAMPPDRAHALVAASGCATAKVKVADRGAADGGRGDLARVEAVRDALGASGRLRVDANGAWDVDTAVRMIRALDAFDLEYVEQPVATLAQMAAVRARVDVPLAADESVRTADDPLRVRGLDAADVVVLKAQPLGGVRQALRVAEAAGLPAVVSSAVETFVGLAAGVALAAVLPELPYACGLGTAALLAGDVVADPLVPSDGHVQVRRPVVDPSALSAWQPPPGVATALRQRLRAAELAGRPVPS
ncbi:MAG: o-succinylbenzoate synthase [Actinobacteria bacterium]|nr:o-succinylbenzoate synthase [Actinomycetota bacterium]